MTARVLHIDFASLSPQTDAPALEEVFTAAACLASLSGVSGAAVIEAEAASDFRLAFVFGLEAAAAVERFGTDPAYARFLQGSLAPRLRAFAGVDVRLEAELEFAGHYAAVLALAAPAETYDWEVVAALRAWAGATGAETNAVGLALGERQRYRGAALALSQEALLPRRPPDKRWQTALVWGRLRPLP